MLREIQSLQKYALRYAAIDPGSTGTRAVIAVAKIDKVTGKRKLVNVFRIQDFREDDDRDRRTTRGEWPSKCCPFDGRPHYVGYDADSQVKKRTISIKAIPYFRAQDDDGHPFTKALYDHSKSLSSGIEREDFDDVLDDILFSFLYEFSIYSVRTSCPTLGLFIPSPPPEITTFSPSYLHYKLQISMFDCQSCISFTISSADTNVPRSNKVVQRIFDKCKAAGVKLRSLALCVPQTWSRRETPIQEYLGPILDDTVDKNTVPGKYVETTFALEAQCQAQHLISKYPEELRDCNEMMVLDFGGHSMVLDPSCRRPPFTIALA